MISEFIDEKLQTAKYKILEDGNYFGEIPSINGVWGYAKTLEKCRKELQEVLEEWIVLKIRDGEKIQGLSFNFKNILTNKFNSFRD